MYRMLSPREDKLVGLLILVYSRVRYMRTAVVDRPTRRMMDTGAPSIAVAWGHSGAALGDLMRFKHKRSRVVAGQLLTASMQSVILGSASLPLVLMLPNATDDNCTWIQGHVHSRGGAALPCRVLAPLPKSHWHSCSASNASASAQDALLPGVLHLAQLDESDALRLQSSIQNTFAHIGKGARTDYATAGAWYRFLLHRLLLPRGVQSVLYLDEDTIACGPIALVLQSLVANSTAAAGVFYVPGNSWSALEFAGANLTLTASRWGFRGPEKDGFKDPMVLFNLGRWCRRRLFDRMEEVARYHADVQRIWAIAGDQSVMQASAAQHVLRIGLPYLLPYAKLPQPGFNCLQLRQKARENVSALQLLCHNPNHQPKACHGVEYTMAHLISAQSVRHAFADMVVGQGQEG